LACFSPYFCLLLSFDPVLPLPQSLSKILRCPQPQGKSH
jgi:hypothetical protein